MNQFTDRVVQVTVPATSANLGPGFDCFGLALGRYDEVSAHVIPSGLEVLCSGESATSLPRDERHLIVRTMRATFTALGAGQPSGLRLSCVNRIPHSRGLGSSAAAIVAGVELARKLVLSPPTLFQDADALAFASAIEGHPDNVAACFLGGLTTAWVTDGRADAVRVEPQGVLVAAFIPPDESSTARARKALPEFVPHRDAAFNAARSALLLLALTGHPQLLFAATEDRLHQPYRAADLPASSQLVADLRSAGLAAVISGAGSTVLVLARSHEELFHAGALAPAGWEFTELSISDGARTWTK